jgi:CMP-N-acetylneuraminic acid synthetase
MDGESSVDIDTPLDLKIAALILQERLNACA